YHRLSKVALRSDENFSSALNLAIRHINYHGIRWSILPDCYPPKSTVHRWFQKWVKNGALKKAMNKIISFAEQEGLVKLAKSFIDGTFLRSKNGSDNVGKTKVGKGHKLMAIVDENGIPVSVNVTSANPHESQLVEDTLQKISTQQLPEKIIGDRAYDSDPLDDLMNEYNIQMIAPHKSNRVNKT
ncbi:MAG: IS5 family transposase, partial [Oligoflexales bacterium]|nr:IS5 family transposase [Oligoflexales bacterium]